MSIGKWSLLCWLVMAGFMVCSAQPLREPTYEMKLNKAYELAEFNEFYNALDLFQECYRESRDRELLLPIARMNFQLRDFERAERYYERALDHMGQVADPVILLEYAKTLKVLQERDRARELFQEFLGMSSTDSLELLARNALIGMEEASAWEQSGELFVNPLSDEVNTGLTDGSPALGTGGELYYATFDKRSTIVIEDAESDDYFLQIYSVKKDEDGEWDKAKAITKKVNREGYHTGNVVFSADGETMYFTRAKLDGNRVSESVIYVSEYDGKDWTGPQPLQSVNGDWIATQPAPGELFGNNVLYFVSDMPGTKGGYDIFYATHEGGVSYGDPVNLGEVINGPGDEMTPFYREGTLYFSSDGLPGAGGLDIFRSDWDGTRWSKPANMKLPFNSPFDDFYLRFVDDRDNGFLVSNRPYQRKRSPKNETCCDDIFMVARQDIELDLIATVVDESQQAVNGTTLRISEIKRKGKEMLDEATNKGGNEYNIPLQVDKAYMIRIMKEGYFPDSFEVNTVGYTKDHTFREEVMLLAKEPETVIVEYNEPIRLNKIYYDFDDWKILPEAEPDLEMLQGLMNEYPDMVIELASHTDARGNDEYNMDLSQRRANSAKQWLVERGISENRIKAVGYGESRILNRCENGVECTEDEHRFNRRTEFKIIEGPTSIKIRKEVVEPQKNGPTGMIEKPGGKGSRGRVAKAEKPARKSSYGRLAGNSGGNGSPVAVFASLDQNHFKYSAGGESYQSKTRTEKKQKKREVRILRKYDFIKSRIGEIEPPELMDISGAPEITFLKSFHDFGVVPEGDRLVHRYHFVNTGSADLLLDLVTAGDDTRVYWTDRPLQPGEKGEIIVEYDSSDKEGEYEVAVSVICNIPRAVSEARFRAFIQR